MKKDFMVDTSSMSADDLFKGTFHKIIRCAVTKIGSAHHARTFLCGWGGAGGLTPRLPTYVAVLITGFIYLVDSFIALSWQVYWQVPQI